MATDKLDIIIMQQAEQGKQLAGLVSTVGEHVAEIRNLKDSVARIEGKVDKIYEAKSSGALAGDAAGELLSGVAEVAGKKLADKIPTKIIVVVGTALASMIAALVAAVAGAN